MNKYAKAIATVGELHFKIEVSNYKLKSMSEFVEYVRTKYDFFYIILLYLKNANSTICIIEILQRKG